jgi:hypothetical protein
MTIINPCKKCLVNVMCQYRCNKRQDYWDTRYNFFKYLTKIMLVLSFISILHIIIR